jgi:hypothetical protein
MLRRFFLLAIFLFCLFFFSYKLTKVPPGLTGDEAAFGYNAILLSRTARDENNRLLPVFVLSLGGKDWRQPVTQYFITIFFKVFGPSVYNLRLTSVIIVSASATLIFLLAEQLLGKLGAFFAVLFFVTTPILMIQSHLALDNIAPIPFILVWLLFLYLFEKRKKYWYLIVSAVCLGIGFYSYKGMRSFVPVWTVTTCFYLLFHYFNKRNRSTLIKEIKPVLVFVLSIFPFFAIIPYLEFKYAGAVLGGVSLKNVESVYKFLYYFLSSFDPSFLFISGDEISTHSTHVHGMLLLASFPFFLIGIYESLKRNKFWKLLIVCFFIGPILFGTVSSYHRASRLLELIPIYCLICGLGAKKLLNAVRWQKLTLVGFWVFVFINYGDFLNYYWYQYSKDYGHTFNQIQIGDAYKYLYEKAKTNNLTPYVSLDLVDKEQATQSFLRSIYFDNSLGVWSNKYEDFPKNAILMSTNSDIKKLKEIGTSQKYFFFYTK